MQEQKESTEERTPRGQKIAEAMTALMEITDSEDQGFVMCKMCKDGDIQVIGHASPRDLADFVSTILASNSSALQIVMNRIAMDQLADDDRVEAVDGGVAK